MRRAWLGGLAVVLVALAFAGTSARVLALVATAALGAMFAILEPTLARLRRHTRALERLALSARKTRTGIVITDTRRHIEWVNAGWEELTGVSLAEARGQDPGELLRVPTLAGRHEKQNVEARARMRAALAKGLGFRETVINASRSGPPWHADLSVEPLHDRSGHLDGYIGVVNDVSQREVALERVRLRARVLEVIQARAPLHQVLESLTETLAKAFPQVIPSVLLVEQGKLRHGAAAGLSADYTSAIDGTPIGPMAGSCGSAAWSGELVVVTDIEADARWAPYLSLTRREQLRACWSQPVKSRRGDVVATLALYSRVPTTPTPEDLALLAEAAELLGIAFAQREVEQENALLRAAIESAAEAVLVANADGRIAFRNWSLEALTNSLKTNTLDEFLTALFDETDRAALSAAVQTSSGWEGRIHRLRAAGPSLTLDVKVMPVHTLDAGGIGTLITMSDATAREEKALREQLSLEGEHLKSGVAWALASDAPFDARCAGALATLLSLDGGGSSGALYLVDLDAPGTLRLFSYVGDEPRGREPGAHCRLQLAVQTQPTIACDESHGHYVLPLVHLGEALGYLVLDTAPRPSAAPERLDALHDIADLVTIAVVRHRASELLERSRVAAEAANRAKGEFLAMMSHEIRTPMNGILGFSELLLDAPLPDEQRSQLALIHNSAEALLTVINDVLDYSKIEAGKFVIDPQPMALAPATTEPLALLRESARKKAIALEVGFHEPLPAVVLLDPLRYRQVLLNLVGNALKFTERGSVKVTVRRRDEALRVEVRDTGVGIPAEVLPKLFARFVQADSSTSRKFGGTGLGLAISKRLVELMGGVMGVESELGCGSTFWFELPLIEAQAPVSSPGAVVRADQRRRRVLVAEDNEVNQLLARRVLERLGCEVLLAVNGVEAVELAQTSAPDLILMDCQMPELDGFAATREIRRWEAAANRARMPIVALTASAFVDDVARCHEAGMDDVLTKPFKATQLERILEAA